jgi:GTP1/Obg family GTP-binding protein
LFLIGATGVGKSYLAQKISNNYDAFIEGYQFTSETIEIKSSLIKVHEKLIRVIDTPGLEENRLLSLRILLDQLLLLSKWL